ncbi:hypothetical protein CB0940_05122 [Cercospora beticola]|uniref:Heterokaryon incompatibility domain-containing protein n=1 Tax=Cercospora beticola TaxID=122368 RepID=A0A2G5HL00_CERBT|nr:hypothetical protein CB0940_05122 [Cercospora beticola]PIA93246.1 hypothetical protein CB0940_05122 [Cercospora beticola]WPB02427.1 hypothetical protein RHO25_007061 [Cercospora beticola]CAK1362682.1 unnamed protein product [Cercospora beticola]
MTARWADWDSAEREAWDVWERKDWNTAIFEGVDSGNDVDNLFGDAAYAHDTSEFFDDYSFHGSSILTEHVGAEGPYFRLLRIRPGQFEADIHCDLIKRPIYEAGLEYSALSYSWGRDPKAAAITIGPLSQSFRITWHLLEALRRLRNVTRLVYIWVDAICINQMDLEEKAAQSSTKPKKSLCGLVKTSSQDSSPF